MREEFVSEMIHFGNGARSLVSFVLADESAKVKVAAISALAWVSLEGMNQRLSELDENTFEAAGRELPPKCCVDPNRPHALATFRKL